MFKPKKTELGLYFMKNFVVGPNHMKLKYTRHKLKLAFTHKTAVEKSNDHLFHVIREVVSYGEVESHNQGDKTSTFMNVELEDHEGINFGNILRRIRKPDLATLGGITSSTSHSGYATDKSSQISRYSVRNTWHASKLWINPNLPQAVDFKCRLASLNEANSSRINQIPSQRSYSVSDELATGIVEVKTIRELVDCMEEGQIWIVATVVNS
nr:uncharacterized protein LOC108946247 [Nicotiana tomentosiformis]